MKFFIVDDDPFCRSLYQQHLINLGFRNNVLFDNTRDCLERLDQQPDIIFLDYDIPPFNGIEVLKKVKKSNPDIHLFIISSHRDTQLIHDALENGAMDFIPKGENDLEMISQVIRKVDWEKKHSNAIY